MAFLAVGAVVLIPPTASAAPALAPGGLSGLTPARLLDTRAGGGPVCEAETRNLTVVGAGGVPATGVDSVVLNVTVAISTLGLIDRERPK